MNLTRFILAWNVIDAGFSERIIRQLLAWAREKEQWEEKEKTKFSMPTLFINSGGGQLKECWAIIDILKTLNLPIRTVGLGSIESGALLLFTAGTERIIGLHASCMIHHYQWPFTAHPSYNQLKARRKPEDILKKQVEDFYIKQTKLSRTDLQKFFLEGDKFFTAKEAIQWGFAHKLLD